MRENNIVQEKSYAFAIRIVLLGKTLIEQKKEYVLSKQIVRSGTSIGANIEEALGGQSDRDFYAKFVIAYKEARETRFWLRLLRDTGYINQQEAASFIEDIDELLKIIGSITKTLKNKLNL